ncbi:MAG: hypothetical protein JWR26_3502 [Pedosphaera sp.]|nr:hypothetical protein [Pedosphaera sp.]
MNLQTARQSGRGSGQSAFTLMEVMVAGGIGLLVIALCMDFVAVTGRALSGTTAQTVLNGEGGYVLAFIKDRVRLATVVSNDASGNTLTLGYDDNPNVDSDGDGVAYNDKDHFERFQVQNIGTTSSPTNILVYYANITNSANRALIKSGVANLPGWNVFTVTNRATVLIRLGIVDSYARDYFQAIDIQGAAVALNRQATTNLITILP